jgi:membrane-associated protease RseP (regulator of RpoE activity)
MQWYYWLILLIAMFAFAQLMRILFKAKVYYFLISMVSNEKSAKVLDKIKNDKFWLWISKIGIFLGFGLFGILAWYWKDLKQKKNKALTKVILYSIFILIIGFFLGNFGVLEKSIVYYIVNVIVFFLFGFAGFGILLLLYQAIIIIKAYFLGRPSCPGVAPVIPGIKIPGTDFKIPFFEGWIALILIMVVHELAHGILARKIKVKVKSFGLLLLGFFPIGAFTEPDEKQLKEAKPKDALLVYAAGPVINLLFALIIFIIVFAIGIISAGYVSQIQLQSTDGVYLTDLSQYTGLCNLGVKSENYDALIPLYLQLDTNKELFFQNYTAKIIEFDNNKINNKLDFTKALSNAIDNNKASVNFSIFVQDENKTKSFVHNFDLKVNSDNTLGVKVIESQKDDYNFSFWYLLLTFILTTLTWTYLLSFMVGFFNFVPVKLLDGGQMLSLLMIQFFTNKMSEKKQNKVIRITYWTIGILLLLLIAINILPIF